MELKSSLELPSGWSVTNIAGEAELLTGFPFASNQFAKSGVRLARGSNIKRGEIDWSAEITKFWPAISDGLKVYELAKGDVVVAMDGALVGESYGTVTVEDLPALLVQRVTRIRSSPETTKLVGYWIGSGHFARHVNTVKTHTAIPHISLRDIKEFEFVAPDDLNERKAIVAALADMDAANAAMTKLLVKKRHLRSATRRQLLTGEVRLEGFSNHWVDKRLGEVATVVRGASPRPIADTRWFDQNSSVGWVRISDVVKGAMYLDRTTQRLSEDGISRSRRVKRGSVIMSIAATVGRPSITRIDACIHDGFVVFEDAKIDTNFLYFLLCFLEPGWSSRGQTGSQTNINTTIIKEEAVSLPADPEEQAEIALVLMDMDEEVQRLEDRLAKFFALKQAMMQALLTGRVRLPVEPGGDAGKELADA